MGQETKTICEKKYGSFNSGGCGEGAVYALGFIGAVVYYIQHAETFVVGVTGVLKAFVWPALVVYRLFQYFGF